MIKQIIKQITILLLLVLLINELCLLNSTYIELLTWSLIGPIPTELTLPQLIDHTNDTILNDVSSIFQEDEVKPPINEPNI